MTLTISIAAALIDDGAGELLLVRKQGTAVFMQPGGKIDPGETPLQALARELREELGFTPAEDQSLYLGTFCCEAANEPGHALTASLFHIRARRAFEVSAELEEAIWIPIRDASGLHLAPLTRDHVLPIARRLCT
jgi:mutator protein MutT